MPHKDMKIDEYAVLVCVAFSIMEESQHIINGPACPGFLLLLLVCIFPFDRSSMPRRDISIIFCLQFLQFFPGHLPRLD